MPPPSFPPASESPPFRFRFRFRCRRPSAAARTAAAPASFRRAEPPPERCRSRWSFRCRCRSAGAPLLDPLEPPLPNPLLLPLDPPLFEPLPLPLPLEPPLVDPLLLLPEPLLVLPSYCRSRCSIPSRLVRRRVGSAGTIERVLRAAALGGDHGQSQETHGKARNLRMRHLTTMVGQSLAMSNTGRHPTLLYSAYPPMARIDTSAAVSSVQPFHVRPSGLRPTPRRWPARARHVALRRQVHRLDAVVRREARRSVPSDATRRRSHVSQYVSVVPVMNPTRRLVSWRALTYFAGPRSA